MSALYLYVSVCICEGGQESEMGEREVEEKKEEKEEDR